MSIEIVFETHALSEDNERGTATGWLPGRLCERGRANAVDMGRRRRGDGITAVFTSDLRRAAETAEIAFGDTDISILYDWRLRECDFGTRNGSPAADVKKDRLDYCDRPYPGGESHAQAIGRVVRFLADLPTRWAGRRVMVIGHLATYRALEHVTCGCRKCHPPWSWPFRQGQACVTVDDGQRQPIADGHCATMVRRAVSTGLPRRHQRVGPATAPADE